MYIHVLYEKICSNIDHQALVSKRRQLTCFPLHVDLTCWRTDMDLTSFFQLENFSHLLVPSPLISSTVVLQVVTSGLISSLGLTRSNVFSLCVSSGSLKKYGPWSHMLPAIWSAGTGLAPWSAWFSTVGTKCHWVSDEDLRILATQLATFR